MTRLPATGTLRAALDSPRPHPRRERCTFLPGLTLQEYANAQDLSVHTARCQLKAINQKTGARRQADLVRLLLNSVPPVTPLGREGA